MASQRFRKFSCILYDPLDRVAEFCKSERLKQFAYVLHDKDLLDNNSLKPPHIHLYLEFFNARTESSLRAEFKTFFSQNCFTEVCEDKYSTLAYLIHKFNTDKYQYSESDVFTNIPNPFADICDDNVALSILTDLENKLSLRELVKRYGREVVINYSKYRDYLTAIKQEESKERLYLMAYDDVIAMLDSVDDFRLISSDTKMHILTEIKNKF